MQNFFAESQDILSVLSCSIEQGLVVGKFLEELNLPKELLKYPETKVPMEDCWRIIDAHLNVAQEETHLMSSRPLKRGTTQLIYSNLVHCSNLKEGLELLAEIYNVVHGGNYNFLRQHGSKLSYIVDDRDFSYIGRPSSFVIEVALINIHCALSFLTDYQLKLNCMSTKRETRVPQEHCLNLFNCHVVYGHGFYELSYDTAQAELPFRKANALDLSAPIYSSYVDRLQPQKPSASGQELLKRIEQKIIEGELHQHTIAESFGMSVATLRRKLEYLGTNFRKVTDRIHARMAFDYLSNELSQDVVAEKLGYSDQRSFRRAFKRWYGSPPSTYMATQKQANKKMSEKVPRKST